MDITPALPKGHHIIQSYGAGRFVLQGQEIQTNLLVWAADYHTLEGAELTAPDIPSLINPLPELIIIGTGTSLKPIAPELKTALKNQNLSIELMDTGAACRTYNVLIAEDRRVAALLTLV